MADFEFNLRDIFRIVKRQKWVIILAPIGVGLMTYWSSVTPPPVYEAESVVKISRVAANMQGLLLELFDVVIGPGCLQYGTFETDNSLYGASHELFSCAKLSTSQVSYWRK